MQSGEESSSSGPFKPVCCLHQSQLSSVTLMEMTQKHPDEELSSPDCISQFLPKNPNGFTQQKLKTSQYEIPLQSVAI